ncbi:MAG: acetylornithine transaminase [Deltaproteobacteria bacterium]|nr:acetylornithine transaminase [Deltaproteobacteria bacterium]MBW1920525.1 acetylornithine transaminase [Deltaproteobacteria bacterium]MBW1935069.1 acetylornithine transaminase [Deltaproteobacteria bacterium]MBW1977567.1 acetylornithine transaminase [Deltaproteobacteria bacterium]MBW2045643.1 acetylornithine transaminase [Deltaproteobacteria bacterium]
MNKDDQKKNTVTLAEKYLFPTYKRPPVVFVKGEGCKVWDEDGKEYLDFVGGIAVCALGHSSPVVSKALEIQSKTLVHVSNLYYTRPQVELAELLVQNSFADRVFFCNSGAEANEAAIKLARRYSREKHGAGRHEIISMVGSFHGRTMATLSATGQEKIQKGYDPLLNGFKFVPFNDLASLEKAVGSSTCAVMLEPIQGEGGVVCPAPDYLKGVKEICERKNVTLIFDEVQVGMGRTGKLFAYEHYGVSPHIMTLAKALGNGLPIGAMLSIEEMSSAFGPGSHASTFGGTPLVSAVSKAVLNSLINDGWIDHCSKMGAYFRGRLEELQKSCSTIKEIRGLGLIIGVELDRPAAPIVDSCLEKGFLINAAQEKVLRFVPPLIIQEAEIDRLCEALGEELSA